MISYIKLSAPPLIARTTLAPILQQQASRRTAAWFSSCVQRKRPDSNISGNGPSVRLRINRSSPSNLPTPASRSKRIMGSQGSAASTQQNDVSDVVTDIEDIHRLAILDKQSTYIDPATGFMVFTQLAHLKRGKCCGNQCRHCPYGWSNVKSAGGLGNAAADQNARAVSGDREGTGRLVKRILDGTYYEDDDCSRDETTQNAPLGESQTDSNELDKSQAPKPVTKGQGKGGSAGGTLTSKNVPYTRKGDSGTSQLFTGERRKKDDDLFEALGTVDELCSIAGVVYAELNDSIGKSQTASENVTNDDPETNNAIYGDLPEQLLDVMSRLFDVGSHIARPEPKEKQQKESPNGNKNRAFSSHHTALLEEWIDTMTDQLPELTSFILPTGSPASAQLHVARTVCRRAERRMVPLVHDEGSVDPAALAYVNRLSDYFFTAARFVNYCEDRDEVQYRREERGMIDGGRKETNFQRERVVVKLKK